MSELISNPTFGPDSEAADSVLLPADTGPAESAPTSVVVRYRANADSSDRRENLEEEADPSEPETASAPDRDSSVRWRRTRALASMLARGFSSITKAGIRGIVRYPRSSAVAALSLLILGAILRTQPEKATPPARIDAGPSALLPAVEKGKAEKNGAVPDGKAKKNGAVPDGGPIAVNNFHSTPKTEGGPASESGKLAVSPTDSASNPFPPLPEGALARGQTSPSAESPGTEHGPVPPNQAPASAPPRMSESSDLTLVTASTSDSTPAPLPSTAPSPTPAGPTPPPDTTNSPTPDSRQELPRPLHRQLQLLRTRCRSCRRLRRRRPIHRRL